jgi:hypothetical protein
MKKMIVLSMLSSGYALLHAAAVSAPPGVLVNHTEGNSSSYFAAASRPASIDDNALQFCNKRFAVRLDRHLFALADRVKPEQMEFFAQECVENDETTDDKDFFTVFFTALTAMSREALMVCIDGGDMTVAHKGTTLRALLINDGQAAEPILTRQNCMSVTAVRLKEIYNYRGVVFLHNSELSDEEVNTTAQTTLADKTKVPFDIVTALLAAEKSSRVTAAFLDCVQLKTEHVRVAMPAPAAPLAQPRDSSSKKCILQ